MYHLDELLKLTKQLKGLLDQQFTSKNREKIIKQTDHLIEMRGKHIQDVKPPFTEREKEIGKQIIELNKFIQKQMDRLFTDLKSEMRQVKQKKKSNRKYVNPYENVQSIDGMFMDKKK